MKHDPTPGRLALAPPYLALVLVATAVAALAGCGDLMGPEEAEGDHIEPTLDPCQMAVLVPVGELTAAEQRGIDRAIDMWRAVGLEGLTRGSVDGHQEARRLELTFEQAAPFSFGFYDEAAGRVYINASFRDDHARAITIAHEIGHAYGLPHVGREARTSLMNEANLQQPPTLEDRAALQELRGVCPAATP